MAFPYTNQQVKDAVRAVMDTWQALADDDDQRLAELLPGPALAYLGDEPELAARLRAILEVTPAECATAGYVSYLAILEDDRLRIRCQVGVEEPREFEAGEPLHVWPFETELVDGRWFVDPIRAHDTEEIGTYDWT